MAYLAQDDKQVGDEKDQQSQVGGSDSGPQIVGGASNVVVGGHGGGGPVNAGGAPGGGAWTNIQAYLNANKHTDSSAKALEDRYTSAFDKERESAIGEAGKIKDQAKQTVDSNIVGQDKASQLINQASQQYNYGGDHGQQYKDNVGQLENSLSAEYSGPSSFTYGISNDAQRYSNLGDRGAFRNIMDEIYRDTAGGQMTGGQLALQRQLDTSNVALQNARNSALQQYSGLQGDIDQTVVDTTSALHDYGDQFRNKQEELKTYLGNLSNTARQDVTQREIEARQALDTARASELSGIADLNTVYAPKGWFFDTPGGTPMSDNMSFADAEKFWDKTQYIKNAWDANADVGNPISTYYNNLKSALDNFYSNQTQQHHNTGDAEKRKFNTIMDILGRDENLAQGFDVMGGKSWDS